MYQSPSFWLYQLLVFIDWAHQVWTQYQTSVNGGKIKSKPNYNCGQMSLGHLCNVKNYLCFRTEVWTNAATKTPCCPPLPFPPNTMLKIRWVFKIVWGWGVRLGRWTLIRAWHVRKEPKVQIFPKTFVHDYICRQLNASSGIV